MSADIVKMAVFDDRIVQQQPKYAVEKGALSVTNSPFNAIAANTGQHTYNVLVPSENVFIDRAVDWSSTVYLQMTVVFNGTAPNPTTGEIVEYTVGTIPPGAPFTAGAPFFQFGTGGASLCAFPLQSLTTTMTATINDTTVTINSADVLPQVLRMTDMKKNRTVRTCPTQLDKYARYDDAYGSINSPLQGFNEAMNVDEVPNGAFPSLWWTTASGASLTAGAPPVGGGGTVYGPNGASLGINWTWDVNTGIPCIPWGSPAIPVGSSTTVYFAFRSTEKLVLSPFVFSDVHEWDTGLFGCQNIQLVMNLQAPGRLLRSSTLQVAASGNGGTNCRVAIAPGTVAYNTNANGGFANSRVNLQFLTPSLDVPLPPKSVVPYMEFPRYISSQYAPLSAQTGVNALTSGQGATNSGQTFSSQTITLPTIPDLLIIYVRDANQYSGTYTTAANPSTTYRGPDPTKADFMLPITGISINFDNFAGLLSAHTQEQLYKMSVHNGLEMDWAQWSGVTHSSAPSFETSPTVSAAAGYNSVGLPNGLIPTVGSMLVLKPGRDIVLQAGQAPSLVGNFVLQFNLTVANYLPFDVNPQIVVITANSGFFETIKGSSRVVKGVLTEQDIISAPVAPESTHGGLRRAVGGSILGSLGNAFSRIKQVYENTKPYVSAVKGCLEHGSKSFSGHEHGKTMGSIADALGKVGYGKKGLKDRLM